ncbi:MAG: alkaline phosphatase D family protein [Bacteroidetes bacterium]|nr:alkaline phosphatase D family protein [Bacteroidota bacterium]
MLYSYRLLAAALLMVWSVCATAQTHSRTLPDRMYADSAYAPFLFGVASGDPAQTRVIIWTRAEVAGPLRWQVAQDSAFTHILRSGMTYCTAARDYTTQVDVDGLLPTHHYYYRFTTASGQNSQTGRALTLPDNSVRHFRLALVSCSGAWSGYFNAYRRIAQRDDIDYLVHVGDYIYDDVDPDEHVRMPDPEPQNPSTLAEWRDRHLYYLLDPDLRQARQNKTWIAEWDNHDNHYSNFEHNADGLTAFYEYLPIRMPDTTHPEYIFRRFQFGALADLHMIDMYLFRGREDFAAGKKSILGNVQDAWFKHSLAQSTTTWHLLGNQEMLGSWLSKGIPSSMHPPGDGTYFNPQDWDGYADDRLRFYQYLDTAHIHNLVTLTGDLHMSFIIDLAPDPRDRKTYKRCTGRGSVGVEVLTPSITAGNMDEEHIPRAFIPLFQRISLDLNPHHRWVQFWKHGYTIIDVTPERCVAQFCYLDILHYSDRETYSRPFVVRTGADHWDRKKYKKRDFR